MSVFIGKMCLKPADIVGATVQILVNDIGMIAVYQCMTGRMFASGGTSRTALCVGVGVWNTKIPSCEGILIIG